MSVRAVLFDVYGTLVEIQDPQRPYRNLLKLAAEQHGLTDQAALGRFVMSQPLGLAEAAQQLQLAISDKDLRALEHALSTELDSIRPFPEVECVLVELHRRDILIGVCSNLALPYTAPVRAHFGHLVDEAIWSCAVGSLKPDREIYQAAAARLGVNAQAILMVGDNYGADVVGAREAGLKALHLDRRFGKGDIQDLLGVLDYAR
jgi:HAD superfamily hydrolase (TIGR01509 family)